MSSAAIQLGAMWGALDVDGDTVAIEVTSEARGELQDYRVTKAGRVIEVRPGKMLAGWLAMALPLPGQTRQGEVFRVPEGESFPRWESVVVGPAGILRGGR